jgi:hypothetical protein
MLKIKGIPIKVTATAPVTGIDFSDFHQGAIYLSPRVSRAVVQAYLPP